MTRLYGIHFTVTASGGQTYYFTSLTAANAMADQLRKRKKFPLVEARIGALDTDKTDPGIGGGN